LVIAAKREGGGDSLILKKNGLLCLEAVRELNYRFTGKSIYPEKRENSSRHQPFRRAAIGEEGALLLVQQLHEGGKNHAFYRMEKGERKKSCFCCSVPGTLEEMRGDYLRLAQFKEGKKRPFTSVHRGGGGG